MVHQAIMDPAIIQVIIHHQMILHHMIQVITLQVIIPHMVQVTIRRLRQATIQGITRSFLKIKTVLTTITAVGVVVITTATITIAMWAIIAAFEGSCTMAMGTTWMMLVAVAVVITPTRITIPIIVITTTIMEVVGMTTKTRMLNIISMTLITTIEMVLNRPSLCFHRYMRKEISS